MTTHGSVLSVNRGHRAPLAGRQGADLSGIDKQPTGAIRVRDPGDRRTGSGSGVVGDDVVDRRHHGGQRQAVYAVAREELDFWEGELGRALTCGVFGENMTTSGVGVDELLIGSLVTIGGSGSGSGPGLGPDSMGGSAQPVVLEVCSPRTPCASFAAHIGAQGWVKAFTARGRPGTYFAVRSPGVIVAGAPMEVTSTPEHDVTVADLFAAWSGDLDAGRRIVAAHILPCEQHDELATRVARRLRGPRAPVS